MNLKFYLLFFPLMIFILWIIHRILKNNHSFINSIKSSLSGIIALAIIEGISPFTGVMIPLNLIVVICCSLLGVPGVGTILILNTLLK